MTKVHRASAPSVDSFGVYIHVPFCHKKCDYCAFATWADKHTLIDEYMTALLTDIGQAVDRGLPMVDTVFVGGGTPTIVDADALATCIEMLPLARGAEVTVECNPLLTRGREPHQHGSSVDETVGAVGAWPHS